MEWFKEFKRRIAFLRSREEFNRDLQEEMRFHVEMKAQKYRNEGLEDSAAQTKARRQFGNSTLLEEQGRQAWGWTGIEQVAQDLRIAVRSMRKATSLTVASVLTLALGIGANVAIFSIINAVLLRPFPYKDAERLMIAPISIPDFRDLRESTRSLDSVAIWASNQYSVRFSGEAEQVLGAVVSDQFFSMLGNPELGRTFAASEAYQPVAVISHRLWKTRFGGEGSVLGRTIPLNGESFTIIGVMPDDFQFPNAQFQLWVPIENAMRVTPAQTENRSFRIFRTLAHARPGISREQVDAEAAGISSRLAKDHPDTNADYKIRFTPLSEWILGDVRTGLGILMATAILVLVIASANVANLLLARAVARTREFGVRVSLGAGRLRLIRQSLTESLVIACTGGLLGVIFAYWLLELVPRFVTADLPRISTARVDGVVLAFSVAVCFAATLLFGMAPALRASSTNLLGNLHEGGRSMSAGRASTRLQRTFITAEVVLASVVLVGAGLLVKSFTRLLHVDSGFVADNLLTMNVGLVSYKEPWQRAATISRILDNLSHVRGVEFAGGSTGLPPVTPQRVTHFAAEGVTLTRSSDSAYFIAASPNFFQALGTPILEGRGFTQADTVTAPKVLMLSEGLARRIFPNGGAIGKHVRLMNPEYSDEWRTVVGVVPTVRYAGLGEADQPAVYAPFSQAPMLWMYVMVRHTPDAAGLGQSVRAAIRDVDPKLAPMAIQPMNTVLWGTVAQPRFRTALLSALAGMALLLAAIGIYGVIAYAVTQRVQEIGIRLALGATRITVMRMVLAEALRLCAIALLIGLPASLVAARAIRAMLFQVSATDPSVVGAVAVMLTAVALAAAYIPARRASRLDALTALRYE